MGVIAHPGGGSKVPQARPHCTASVATRRSFSRRLNFRTPAGWRGLWGGEWGRSGLVRSFAMVAQLRRGMTRDQVRYVLGSPLVVDMFRKDRWDYVYRFRPGSGEAQQRVISLFFTGDVLDRIEGDVAAASGTPAAAAHERSRVVEIPPASAR